MILISMTLTMMMSSNEVPQSSDVPTAGTDVEGVSPLVPLQLPSRQGNDDKVGCREIPVVPIAEASVVIAAEAATGVVVTVVTVNVNVICSYE